MKDKEFIENPVSAYNSLKEKLQQAKQEIEKLKTECNRHKKTSKNFKTKGKKAELALENFKQDYCFDCDVAERMRKLVYLVTNGMMSYSCYTYEAIEEVYYEQLNKMIENSTKELKQEIEELQQRLITQEEFKKYKKQEKQLEVAKQKY